MKNQEFFMIRLQVDFYIEGTVPINVMAIVSLQFEVLIVELVHGQHVDLCLGCCTLIHNILIRQLLQEQYNFLSWM